MSTGDLIPLDRITDRLRRLADQLKNIQQSAAATLESCERIMEAADKLGLQEPEAMGRPKLQNEVDE